ncbi:MAG: Holliday junction branch migration protein RuvA [Pseudomonadota bacterium]|jgi:Holliday junction DNA helicase RuvA
MIAQIRGTLIDKTPPHIVIDCVGVGYGISVPMSTFYQLPNVGDVVVLLTVHVVREDAQLLYGFATAIEREAFKAVTKVTGIGPRIGLAVLSGMSVAELAEVVVAQDSTKLATIPGIGKKTAERLLLELKGKLGSDIESHITVNNVVNGKSDMLGALSALGYNDKEALLALKNIPTGTSVSDGIRLALKTLSR